MYELIQTGENSWYLECPARVGIVRLDRQQVCLIDSGSDREAGRKIGKILAEHDWELMAIINTHSNADHIGGNQYLQERTGCRIYASGEETAFIRWPELESAFLYGGYPPAALRNKFLLARPSEVLELAAPGFPAELEVISLPGHFFSMIGLRSPDGTVFLADCLTGEHILAKYRIPFVYDFGAYLDTLNRVAELAAEWFVPAHAPVVRDIRPLVEVNREAVRSLLDKLCALCAGGRSWEEILQRLFLDYGLSMDFNQYVLVGCTVRSALAFLEGQGRANYRFEDNRVLWYPNHQE